MTWEAQVTIEGSMNGGAEGSGTGRQEGRGRREAHLRDGSAADEEAGAIRGACVVDVDQGGISVGAIGLLLHLRLELDLGGVAAGDVHRLGGRVGAGARAVALGASRYGADLHHVIGELVSQLADHGLGGGRRASVLDLGTPVGEHLRVGCGLALVGEVEAGTAG